MIEPGKNEDLLFIWMLQFGAGIGLIVNNQEISRMFPMMKGIVLAILNMASEGSSLWLGIYRQNLITTTIIQIKCLIGLRDCNTPAPPLLIVCKVSPDSLLRNNFIFNVRMIVCVGVSRDTVSF